MRVVIDPHFASNHICLALLWLKIGCTIFTKEQEILVKQVTVYPADLPGGTIVGKEIRCWHTGYPLLPLMRIHWDSVTI